MCLRGRSNSKNMRKYTPEIELSGDLTVDSLSGAHKPLTLIDLTEASHKIKTGWKDKIHSIKDTK